MLNKNRIFGYFDRIIVISLCFLIFCLPFAKAGMETFTWLAIFLWILKRPIGYRTESLWGLVPKTELNKAIGIFITANALSTIFTANFGLSLRGFFGKELKFVIIYFMLLETINSRQRLNYILMTIIASSVLMIVDAGMQHFRGIDFIRGYEWARLNASFPSANDFAGWLIIVIPLILGILATKKTTGGMVKLSLMVLIMLLLICLIMTFSRGGWLGFITGVCFAMAWYVLKRFRLKTKLLFLSTGIGILVIFLCLPQSIQNKIKAIGRISVKDGATTINTRIKSILDSKDYAIGVRINLWKECLTIIRDFPLIGCGLNTYSNVVRDYKSFECGGTYTHNSYLQMIAETGLLGLSAFFGIFSGFFRATLRYVNKRNDYLVLGLLVGILSFLVQSFFDTHLYALQMVVLFWFTLGLTISVMKLNYTD